MKPVRVPQHPFILAAKGLDLAKVSRKIVTARSYHYLVTNHNVSPEKAKQWLGIPPEKSFSSLP